MNRAGSSSSRRGGRSNQNSAGFLQQQLPFAAVSNPVFTSQLGTAGGLNSNVYINPAQVSEELLDTDDELANAQASM